MKNELIVGLTIWQSKLDLGKGKQGFTRQIKKKKQKVVKFSINLPSEKKKFSINLGFFKELI